MAMEQGRIRRADLVLLFSTVKHDPERLRSGVREVVGDSARIMGGYAVGIITHDFLAYDGSEVGVAVFAVSRMTLPVLGGISGWTRTTANMGVASNRRQLRCWSGAL